MINKKRVIVWIILVFLILVSVWFFINNPSNTDSFRVNNILIESKIKVGESISNNIEVYNLEKEGDFEANLVGFNGLAVVPEKSFYLGSSESKIIKIFFNDSLLVPGVYTGYLSIKNKFNEKKIPIILSIETKPALFEINLDVAPEDKQLNKGETTKTNLKFISLSDTNPHTVMLNYEITNIEGKSIVSEQKETVVTFSSSITKTIDLSEDIEAGDYIFTVVLTSGKSLTSSSYLFSVDGEKKQSLFFSIKNILIFIFCFVVIVFILVGYMFYERNKLFSKLKIQQDRQIKFYSDQINKQQKKSLIGAKTEKERKRILKEFKRAKKKILGKIREEQIKQKKEFERIRDKKSNRIVEKKINDWKKSVYPNAVKQLELSHGLKIKLVALERAYDEGYITKQSYNKGRERINKIKGKLKRNIYK